MKWIDLTVTYNKHFSIEKNTVTCGCFKIKMEHHSNTWNCPEKLLSDHYQRNRWLLPLQSKLPDVFSWLRYSLQRNFDSNDTAWQHNLQCALFLCQIYQCNMYKLGKFDLWKNKGQEFFIIFSSSRFIDNIDSDKSIFSLRESCCLIISYPLDFSIMEAERILVTLFFPWTFFCIRILTMSLRLKNLRKKLCLARALLT